MRSVLFVCAVLLTVFAAAFFPADVLAGTSGWLGVEVRELDDSMKEALDYKGEGVLVKEVYEGSPASKGGLSAGDIIYQFAGSDVKDLKGFVGMVRESEPGTSAGIKIIRKGKKKDLTVEIGERERSAQLEKFGKNFKGLKSFRISSKPYLGVEIEDLNEDLGEYFKTGDGALVLSVKEESPAAEAGIRAGDVLKEIDGTRIHDADDVLEVLEHSEKGDKVEIKLMRKGVEQMISVELGETEKAGSYGWRNPEGDHFFWHSPGHGSDLVLPDLGDIELHLEDLEEYLESEEFGEDVDRHVELFRDLGNEKLEKLEEKLDEMAGKLKEMEKKLAEK